MAFEIFIHQDRPRNVGCTHHTVSRDKPARARRARASLQEKIYENLRNPARERRAGASSKIAEEHPELAVADSIYRLPWDAKKKFGTATMNSFMEASFRSAGVQAPAGFKYTWHMLRHGSASAAAALGVPERRIKDFGNWARKSDAYERYIHTVPATTSGQRFFGWMLPVWALEHPSGAVPVLELL